MRERNVLHLSVRPWGGGGEGIPPALWSLVLSWRVPYPLIRSLVLSKILSQVLPWRYPCSLVPGSFPRVGWRYILVLSLVLSKVLSQVLPRGTPVLIGEYPLARTGYPCPGPGQGYPLSWLRVDSPHPGNDQGLSLSRPGSTPVLVLLWWVPLSWLGIPLFWSRGTPVLVLAGGPQPEQRGIWQPGQGVPQPGPGQWCTPGQDRGYPLWQGPGQEGTSPTR